MQTGDIAGRIPAAAPQHNNAFEGPTCFRRSILGISTDASLTLFITTAPDLLLCPSRNLVKESSGLTRPTQRRAMMQTDYHLSSRALAALLAP